MIGAIIILSLVIIILCVIGFFWFKKLREKNESLQFKLDLARNKIDDLETNKENYLKIIDKLSKRRKEHAKFKETVNNASGSDLADLANGL